MDRTVIFRICAGGYRNAAAALTIALLLAGCGGGSSSPSLSDVQKAVRVRHPDSSEVRCARHGELGGKQVYRCRIDLPVGLHVMQNRASCYTFEHGRLEDVTRHVRC